MRSALIHFEPCFSKADQSIFLKRTLKKIKKTVFIDKKPVFVYHIPVNYEKPSQKAVNRFIDYLKEEKIEKIILSESADLLPCSDLIKKEFSLFYGSSVIFYKLYDILRKYALANKMELSECTLVLCTDNPETAKNIILKIYKNVKKIKIKTEKKDLFNDMACDFLYEYGLFIEVVENNEKLKNEIYFADNDDNDANLYLYHPKKSKIIFSVENKLKDFHYFKETNQAALEFLAESFYNSSGSSCIKQFFKIYSPRIIKIKNND